MVSCLGHVINLGNVDVMGHITKIAAVENATAIWEYDPTREDNRVLGGSLDVIAAIRTLAIKVIIIGIVLEKFNISHAATYCRCLDSSIWTAHRVLSQHPDPLRIPRGLEDSIA